jgi:hypothetical protein
MIGRKGRDVPLHSKEVGTKEVNLHGVLTMDEKDSVPWSMNFASRSLQRGGTNTKPRDHDA